MAKHKPRKRKGKPALAIPPPTAKQHSLTTAISRLNRFLTVIVGLPLLYITYYLRDMLKVGGRVVFISSLLFLVVMTVKLWLDWKAKAFGHTPYWNQAAHLDFRKYMVWLLTLSFFANALVIVPIFYVNGYIARLAAFLPGKEQVSPKVSLLLAFAAGAIVSGVLGNVSYDLLKFLYRKVRE